MDQGAYRETARTVCVCVYCLVRRMRKTTKKEGRWLMTHSSSCAYELVRGEVGMGGGGGDGRVTEGWVTGLF